MDTIFAEATVSGKAGVAIIRISGREAATCLRRLGGYVPTPRFASLQSIHDTDGSLLDEALVLYFEKGKSFTGEEVVELQVHGSRAIVARIFEILVEEPGCRLAEPGEFTRRAALAGRLDLAQAEGLADLIDAETEAQRKQAQKLLSGELSERVSSWRAALIEARALLEVTIDFADEDVPVDVSEDVLRLISEVQSEVRAALGGAKANAIVRNGFEVAIVGVPNAGKSTLLNALAGRDAALTSDIAGTTRDIIEVRLSLNGMLITVLDTAGLRAADDEIERMGVERAMQRAGDAHLRVFLVTSDGDNFEALKQPADIVLQAKDDTGASGGVSGKTGFGVEALLKEIGSRAASVESNAVIAVNARHASALQEALAIGDRVLERVRLGPDAYDLAGEDVRLMAREMENILGVVEIESVYDVIFGRFCLGK
ncbi:tRNA uridine-5-carboxymethylaminomethyl(34) synthesis GTPase MnmE [Roseobacteraceae bacterium S113]